MDQPGVSEALALVQSEVADDGWTVDYDPEFGLAVCSNARARDSLAEAPRGRCVHPRELHFNIDGSVRLFVGGESFGPEFSCGCGDQFTCFCISGAIRKALVQSSSLLDVSGGADWRRRGLLNCAGQIARSVRQATVCCGLPDGLQFRQRLAQDPTYGSKSSVRLCEYFGDDGAKCSTFHSRGCARLLLATEGCPRSRRNGALVPVCVSCYEAKALTSDSRHLPRTGPIGNCAALSKLPDVDKQAVHETRTEAQLLSLSLENTALRSQLEERGVPLGELSAQKQEWLNDVYEQVCKVARVAAGQRPEGMSLDEYRLFVIQEQMLHVHAEQNGDTRTFRWHPRTLTVASQLMAGNQAGARLIARSGLLALPALSTVQRHGSSGNIDGSNPEWRELVRGATAHLTGQGKVVNVNHDEIHLLKGLWMRSQAGGGFVLVGLASDWDAQQSDDELAQLAMSAVLFLATPLCRTGELNDDGVRKQECFPLAVYPVQKLDAGNLGVFVLEVLTFAHVDLGLHVIGFSSDGASSGRLLAKAMCEGVRVFSSSLQEDSACCMPHPFAPGRLLVEGTDATHKEKCAMNALFSSRTPEPGADDKTTVRTLHLPQFGEHGYVVWQMIEGIHKFQEGMLLKPYRKVTAEVVARKGAATMRVNLARAVLSEEFAATLESYERQGSAHALFTTGLRFYIRVMLRILEPMRGAGPGYNSSQDARLLDMHAALGEVQAWHDSFGSDKAARARGFIPLTLFNELKAVVHCFAATIREMEAMFPQGFEPFSPTVLSQDRTEAVLGQLRHLVDGGAVTYVQMMQGTHVILKRRQHVTDPAREKRQNCGAVPDRGF